MAVSYSVLVIDNYHMDPEEDFTIDGFPTLELAQEFARRWTRSSVEEQRKPDQAREDLSAMWGSREPLSPRTTNGLPSDQVLLNGLWKELGIVTDGAVTGH